MPTIIGALQALGKTFETRPLKGCCVLLSDTGHSGQQAAELFIVVPRADNRRQRVQQSPAFAHPSLASHERLAKPICRVGRGAEDRVVHPWFTGMADGQLHQSPFRSWVIGFAQSQGKLQADAGVGIVLHAKHRLNQICRAVQPRFAQAQRMRAHGKVRIGQSMFDIDRFEGLQAVERAQSMQAGLRCLAVASQRSQRAG